MHSKLLLSDSDDSETLAEKDGKQEVPEEDDEELSVVYRSKQFAKTVSLFTLFPGIGLDLTGEIIKNDRCFKLRLSLHKNYYGQEKQKNRRKKDERTVYEIAGLKRERQGERSFHKGPARALYTVSSEELNCYNEI